MICFSHVVCGEDDGRADFLLLSHDVVQLDASGNIQPSRRLIQEEHGRVMRKRQGKRKPPLLAGKSW